tara:strand:- start:28858 stop:29427 length:570 start_codon:yes stop_codon:yes gene_type:complete
MALTPSTMMPLGTPAPDFLLINVITNRPMTLDQVMGKKGLIVAFICNHCPFVQRIWPEFNVLSRSFIESGVGVVAISANDSEQFPDDGPEAMKQTAEKMKLPYPYLFDADQSVAKAYQAACTPDLYLFDADKKCVYRGQFDGSRPENDVPVTGEDLRHAVMCLLSGIPNDREQHPSIGCNIKWRSEKNF